MRRSSCARQRRQIPGSSGFFSNLAMVTSIAAADILGAVLVGWLADLPLLTSVRAGWISVKANTAVGLVVAGGVLALCVLRKRGTIALAHLGAMFLAALGLATLFQ
jgi:Ca2+/Na+ antiporter